MAWNLINKADLLVSATDIELALDGLAARITDAQGTGFDGRIARLTISFTVPAPVAGIA